MSTLNNDGINLSITTPHHRISAVGDCLRSSPPQSAVLLDDPSNPPFCLPPPPDAATVSSLSSTSPPPPPPCCHLRCDRPTACLREATLPPPSSLPPPPPPAHSHRAVHRPLSLQPARCHCRCCHCRNLHLIAERQRPASRSQWLAEAQWTEGRRQRLPPLTATTSNPPFVTRPLPPPT